MDEIKIDTIEWSAPEYSHKERGPDWFWAIGLVTIVSCALALWLKNNIFAIFLAVSGASLVLFSLRHPREVTYTIETKGFSMGKDLYEWKDIKSFNIKNDDSDSYAKLIIETKKYFLPVYTIPAPKEKAVEMKETLLKVIPRSEIDESRTMLLMEKWGL